MTDTNNNNPTKSRRQFLALTAATTAASIMPAFVSGTSAVLAQSIVTPLLDPTSLQQFVDAIKNPLSPDFPGVRFPDAGDSAIKLHIRETMHTVGRRTDGTPVRSRLWGYALGDEAKPTFPGPTIEVQRNHPLSVTYINDLQRIPNRMPVDTTMDWANPGSLGGLAPVPLVTHLHGSRTETRSDGLPDGWSTPGDVYTGRLFQKAYAYEQKQEGTHMWYHDHARGITRTNVYMGLAGNYIVRDANEHNLQQENVLPAQPYEVALMLQDRQFSADGNPFYPATDPSAPDLPNPTHLPEFFGDVLTVNGTAWPKMTVERRKYRFRILNGSDSRFYALKLQQQDASVSPSVATGTRAKLMVIGNDEGILDTPAYANWNTPGGITEADMLLIAPGERYDVIIDFSAVTAGTRLILWTDATAPYNGSPADDIANPGYAAPTPGTTDRVMAFDVVAMHKARPNATVAMGTILRRTPGTAPIGAPKYDASVPRRRILLLEGNDSLGRLQDMLGPVDYDAATRQQGSLTFSDPITERPEVGTTEIWEFHNTTADAHPIHMHLVDFRILERQPFTGTVTPKTDSDNSIGGTLSDIVLTGAPVPVDAWQGGKKDTVVAYPGYITRILVHFTRVGEYVYHCHILSHEDHEMMRPYSVVPSSKPGKTASAVLFD